MRHGTIIKSINKTFLEEWSGSIKIHLDSSKEITDKNPYISIKYEPSCNSRRYLGTGIRSIDLHGTLRLTIYNTNPTTCMVTLVEVIEFLKDNIYNNLRFTELEGLSAPYRKSNGDLYSCFIDFDACLIH